MSALPTMTPLESTALSGYHYDPSTKKLTVQFKSGKHFEYDDVSMERAVSLEGSDSPGRYFGAEIKGNHIGREVFGKD